MTRQPEDLLRELGISEPEEIDVEAVAQYCGATVIERPLTGCEARIVGLRGRAVITVNASSIRARRRFSAAHELGHWMRDRGKVALRCNPEGSFGATAMDREARADRYASDLLMPCFMFGPRSTGRPIHFETVSDLADTFQTSLTATAIRLVDISEFPSIVACSDRSRLRWFHRSADVPRCLWPQFPGRVTFAFDLLHARSGRERTGEVSSDGWFSIPHDHFVHEDSRRIGPEQVLTLLSWNDERPLIELQEEEERRESRRSDGREDD